jgi:hypothetical protein
MSRGFDPNERDLDERPESEVQSRMPLSQGRGGGSGTNQALPPEFDLSELRERIDRAATGSPTVEEFLSRLEQEHVRPIPSIQSSGRWNGMSYEFAGIRVNGSELGRAYTALAFKGGKASPMTRHATMLTCEVSLRRSAKSDLLKIRANSLAAIAHARKLVKPRNAFSGKPDGFGPLLFPIWRASTTPATTRGSSAISTISADSD